ncbi:unnamed protein product [Ranitomeya imitator]|uniref:Uncharacterized protein n=1 Tax=Ranitomeya imitator TaxID=111125 RepID=A0ABN9MIK1_9NEOB|nr:unnamed protein product [Ranitomeya imitator]
MEPHAPLRSEGRRQGRVLTRDSAVFLSCVIRPKAEGSTPGGHCVDDGGRIIHVKYRYTKRLTNDHDQRYDLAVIVGVRWQTI